MQPVVAMHRHATSTRTEPTLYHLLTESHRHLEALFGRLLAALDANAPDVREMWNELDHGLLAHMEAEERFVLPAFARVHREDAVALLREHGKIREQLLELGVAVDLHHIRVEQSRAFIEALRGHAERESKLLYRWTDEHLDPTLVERARRHLAAR